MKKLLLFTAFMFMSANVSHAYLWTNDLRTLFQNGQANIYVMNVRTFSAVDTNNDEIIQLENGETPGTFTGAMKRLDTLQMSGINTIHLLPITPVGKLKALGTAGSLYAMDDFSSINPQLDDKMNYVPVYQEAKQFIEEAHKRGIRVIVDLPACGSYDMSLRRPELFEKDESGNTISPSDWKDVRLFKVQNANGTLNDAVYSAHTAFVDMVKDLGADGIRADVATIKPYEFWKKLIDYARRDDKEFLFVAEASPEWRESVSKYAQFTPYDKLMSAGFDGYLGDFMNYSKFQNTSQLFEASKQATKLSEKLGEKKSIILNFATHDDLSPVLVNPNYPMQILWLSAVLPGNMYFVNGFMSDDSFVYNYANKKAEKTYTDNPVYYVHGGKLDIFNYSRRPGGKNPNFSREYAMASMFKDKAKFMLDTEPNILKTSNPNIFAYEYKSGDYKLIVMLNHSTATEQTGTLAYHGIESFNRLLPVKRAYGEVSYQSGKFNLKLAPSDIAIFLCAKQTGQN